MKPPFRDLSLEQAFPRSYATAVSIIQGRKIEGLVQDPDGTWRCPTEKCGALCCTTSNPFGDHDKDGPCQFLDLDDLKCRIQKSAGNLYKPLMCVLFPRSQADVDAFNAAHAVGDRKCYLKVH